MIKATSREDPPKLHLLIFASSFGGICSGFLTLPFDVVKVRLQSQLLNVYSTSLIYCNQYIQSLCVCTHTCNYNKPNALSETYSVFQQIMRETGPRGFWRGLTPTLIQSIPQVTIYYTLYQRMKHSLGYVNSDFSNYIPAVAGVCSRSITCFMIAPLELLRTNMQSSSAFSIKDLYYISVGSIRSKGYLPLWCGFKPMLIRDIPFSALYWSGYEALKVHLQLHCNNPRDNISNLLITIISSGLCGSVAAALTTPFDVLKTQIEITVQDKKLNNPKIIQTIVDVYTKSGVKGFFKGVIPRCVKVGPACTIMITTFELVMNFFQIDLN